jgi:uncharacterized protein
MLLRRSAARRLCLKPHGRIRPFGVHWEPAPGASWSAIGQAHIAGHLGRRGADGIRSIHLSTILLPPAVFTGLLGTLWLWKCAMMVVFQNKIIYMPGLPPNARRERIADYAKECGVLKWTEHRIKAVDGTELALASATVPATSRQSVPKTATDGDLPLCHTYVLYFQGPFLDVSACNKNSQWYAGNASSTPPRLPGLSKVLLTLADTDLLRTAKSRCTVACLSYRGFWTSGGRPSEKGINQDAVAAAQWVSTLHRANYEAVATQVRMQLILWGHSIGAGIVTNLAARQDLAQLSIRLDSMILETPFLSIRTMLKALYPQKWVPYQHLWPFLRNHLDSWRNLGDIAMTKQSEGQSALDIIILEAGRDELVPANHGKQLYQRCLDLGLKAQSVMVRTAYHEEVMVRSEGRKAVADFIHHRIRTAVETDGNTDKSP